MRTCRRDVFPLLVVSAAVMVAACGGERPAVDVDEPVVERTTVDGVETVRNVSGSRWGEIQLVLITEIGGEDSDDYMFARPLGIWATDTAVFVADMTMGLRSYTRDGVFIRKYGREGEGPGEYDELYSTAVLADGRVVAQDFTRIAFYEEDGTFSEQWAISPVADGYTVQGGPFLVTANGEFFLRVGRRAEGATSLRDMEMGLVQAGPDGWLGAFLPTSYPDTGREPHMIPCRTRSGEVGECFSSIPYAPSSAMVITPVLQLVSGVTDRYVFEVKDRDGSTMVVERFEEPVELTDLERRYHTAMIEARARQTVPGWELDAGVLPTTKRSFRVLLGSRDGRILATRDGGSHWKEEECGPADEWVPGDGRRDCLEAESFVDIFAEDGSYLGYFELPPRVGLRFAYIKDDEIWAYAEGADGNPVVRGYRLVVSDES